MKNAPKTLGKGTIQRVAVIGAGVMGAGIAAHVANAGIPVLLLDIVPKDAKDRDVVAKGAIEKLKKSTPAALMSVKNAKLITPGNTEDNLVDLKDCDWIVEAVIERLDVKRALYAKIAKVRKKGAVVSSNTSTIPLGVLLEGMNKDFREHFLITHFFNPPRYMRLLEVVTGKDTLPEVVARVSDFADHQLGKSVVPCFDTPGFIANRIGTYWLHAATVHALRLGVTVEAADAVLGKPAGVPKTGVFGLMDLVGLDLMPHVLNSLRGALAESDLFMKLGPAPKLLEAMIAKGFTGRKAKGGFYRLNEKKEKEAMDLVKGEYRPGQKPNLAAMKVAKDKGLRALLEHDSAEGRYARAVLGGMMAYSALLVGEIAADIELIDRAMRLGYGWKYGPFELMDKVGVDWLMEAFRKDGLPVAKILDLAKGRKFYRTVHGQLEFLTLKGTYAPVPRGEGVVLLEDVKRKSAPIMKNISASIWDVGDGVACFEFTSKMNSFNPFILRLMNKAMDELPSRGFKAMVIYNEGSNFSVGANLMMLLVTSKLRAWPLVRWILKDGQETFSRLKYSQMPVVGAVHNMALGGGCEVLLHCHAVVAHAETYMGLVEGGVGIVPGWGGCKEMLGRALQAGGGPMPAIAKTFETIATAKVAKSAAEAKELLFLKPDDEVVMNRDRLLQHAKAKALALVAKPVVLSPYIYKLPGATALTALKLALHDFALKGMATPHDVVVGEGLARVLSGGDTDITEELGEADLLRLERDGLVNLTKTTDTRARIAYMLKHGKPLRN